MAKNKSSHAEVKDGCTKMIEGIGKHFQNEASVTLDGASVAMATVLAALQGRIDTRVAVEAAETARHKAITGRCKADTDSAPMLKSFRGLLRSRFGASSDTLREFGIEPTRPRKPTTEVQAEAVQKRRETRKQHEPTAEPPHAPASSGNGAHAP